MHQLWSNLKKTDGVLAAAIGAGLIFRIVMWKATRTMISFDEANYLRLAGSGLQDGFQAILHPYWSPFYPFITGCFSWITHNPETAGRWVNILAGTAILPLLYGWTRRLFGTQQARWTVWLVALYPPFAFGNTSAMPETVYTWTALLGITLAWRALTRFQWPLALLAGLSWACTYLTKPEGMGFLLIFIVFAAGWALMHRNEASPIKPLLIVLITVLGFVLAASPYLLYLKKATGQWTVSTKGMLNQQMEAAVVFNDGPVKDPFFHVTSDNRYLPYDMGMHFGNFHELKSISGAEDRMVSISFSRTIFKYFQNFYLLLKEDLPQLFGLVLLIFFTAGLMSGYDRMGKKRLLYLGLFIAGYWFGLVPLFHINIRYFMPLFPLIFIWIGAGCHVFSRRFSENFCAENRRAKKTIPVFLVLFLLGAVILPETVVIYQQNQPGPDIWAQPLELKAAGLWLKENTEAPPRLMTLNKAIDFYAGQYSMTEGASFSYDPIGKNIAYARNRHCDYLVFTSRYLTWFANLRPLVEGPVPDGLEMIYDKTDAQGIRAVIYRLKDIE